MCNIYLSATSWISCIIAFIQSQNVAYASLQRTFTQLPAALALFFIFSLPAFTTAQVCGPSTPSFTVNLTGNPDSVWISPNVIRQDLCCNAASNETCVEFVLTLDPASQGIIFNIHSGAVPPGALYYQLNCGMPTTVGQPLCLTGVGPHIITFCKPGGNTNEYSITAIPQTSASGSITLNDGCSGSMAAYGYDPSTVTWNSIYPSAPGTYNSYLDCTAGCDSVNVSPSAGFPPYVDYEVCGLPLGGCSNTTCNTVRVYYNPTLAVSFSPAQPTVCYGQTGTTVTAVPSGGTPPYSYLWSSGATSASVYLAPGVYTVIISDTSDCPPVIDTVVVTGFNQVIAANAGPDLSTCAYGQPLQLNGSVTGVTTGIWSGGNGVFTPGNTALNAGYTPTPAEIAAGQVTLTLTPTNYGTCPFTPDNVTIIIHSFQGSVSASVTDIMCNGNANGSITVSISGGNGPFSYEWNTSPSQLTSIATGLSGGTYSAVITDANGCLDTVTASVNEPAPLAVTFTNLSHVTCSGGNNGTATVQATGGTGNYIYTWSTAPAQYTPTATSLLAGTYNVSVTDANGCAIWSSATITEPAPVATTAQGSVTICPGQQTLITATGTGGNGNYSYNWQPALGNAASHIVSPAATTTYTVTAVDNFGCQGNTATVTVTVMTLTQQNLTVSNPVTICQGQSAVISATVTGVNNPVMYSWSPSIGNGPGPYVVIPSATTNYTVTVSDNCANHVSAVIPVTVNPLPQVTLASQSATACDEAGFTFADSSNISNATYEWDFGDGYSAFTNPAYHGYTQSGNYLVTLTITSAQGCSSAASAHYSVTVHTSPGSQFSTSASELSILDPSVSFYDQSSNASAWHWDFGDGHTSTLPSPSHTYAAKGTYNVKLITWSTGGCSDTTDQDIVVNPETTLFIPNAFTPNNDGRNDIFLAQGIEIVEFRMMIFNRWGDMIFSSDDMQQGWDGKANDGDRTAQEGVYVYKVQIMDFNGHVKEYLGHVSLLK